MHMSVSKPTKRRAILLRATYFTAIGGLLLVAGTAFWLHAMFFDTNRFTETATRAITGESSRASIARAVVDRALQDRPLLRSTIGSQAEGLLSGALGSEFAKASLQKTVEGLQLALTTPRGEPVVLNLAQAKGIIASSQDLLDNGSPAGTIDVSDLPDQIVIIDTEKLPNFYDYSIGVLWAGPLALVAACAMLGAWVYRANGRYRLVRLRIALLIIAATALVGCLIGPLVKPAVLSVAANAPSQTLLGNIYEGFVGPFTNLALFVALAACAVWALLMAAEVFTKNYRLSIRIERKRAAKRTPVGTNLS